MPFQFSARMLHVMSRSYLNIFLYLIALITLDEEKPYQTRSFTVRTNLLIYIQYIIDKYYSSFKSHSHSALIV